MVLALLVALSVACSSVEERRRATLERAERALETGDAQRALEVLDAFRSYDPRDLKISTRMAEIHLELGNPAAASRVLGSVPDDVQLDAQAGAVLARALVDQGLIGEAVRRVSRLEARGEAEPELVDALLVQLARRGFPERMSLPEAWVGRLVRLQIEHLRPAGAAKTLERVKDEELRRELAEEVIRLAFDRGETGILEDVPDLSEGPPSPWRLLARHEVLLRRGLADEAATVERELLSRYPDHPRRYAVLLSSARRELRSGRAEEALSRAKEAAALRPFRTEPLMEQALALEALDRPDEAEGVLELLLGDDPDHPAARRLLRRMDRRRGVADPAPGSATLRLTLDAREGS